MNDYVLTPWRIDHLERIEELVLKFGYLEDRFCGQCQKYKQTIGNECIECGSDT